MSEPTVSMAEATAAGGPAAVVGRSSATVVTREPGIVVRGHGEVDVVPDALRLELAVEAEAPGVSSALASARTTMVQLRSAVAGSGVAREDMRTSGLNVWQRYSDTVDAAVTYLAGESLTVLVRDPDGVDAVLNAASGAAEDRLRVQGLSFVVVDSLGADDAARKLAFADAERVARVYAEALGRALGPVVRLTEGPGDPHPMRTGGRAAALAVGVERGTQTIAADVTVEWAIE